MRQRTKLQLVNLAFVLLFNVGKPSFFLALSILFKQARFAIRNVSGIHNRPDFFSFIFCHPDALLSRAPTIGSNQISKSILYFVQDNSQFITLAVFGSLAIALGTKDVQSHRQQTAVGKERIVSHLTNMMGGTIAVVTAVLVVNVDVEPVWIWWVLPTALITPIILWWSRKTRS